MFREFLISIRVRVIKHQEHQIKTTENRVGNLNIVPDVFRFAEVVCVA